MRRAHRLVLAGGLAVLGCASATGPAAADAPVRTGWWTAATVGGTAAPLPTTADTDLHVASGPQGTLALAAVDYHVLPVDTATLVLHITPNSLVGTPVLYACPTKDEGWKGGGDQPYDTAPVPQCTGRQVQGVVGTDTVTFLLDSRSQLLPGVLSLALVPAAGSTFSLDLTAPGTASLTVAPAEEPAPAGGTTVPEAAPAAVGSPPAAAAPGAPAAAPLPALGPSAPLPAAAPSEVTPPLLAGTPATGGTSAVAAGQVPLQPAAATRLTTTDEGRRLATALLVLLVGAGGYLLGKDTRPPLRLLGGRALRAGPVPEDGPVRGLGRFARPRSAPAGGLR